MTDNVNEYLSLQYEKLQKRNKQTNTAQAYNNKIGITKN